MADRRDPAVPRRDRPPARTAADEIDRLLDSAGVHYLAGRLDEAARLYGQAERADPVDIRARYSLAVIDLRRGRHEAARTRFEAVTRRAPDHYGAWHNLGVVLQASGRWRGAAAAYERALALDPGAIETAFALARALAVIGQIDAAIARYRLLAASAAADRALTRLAILRPAAVTDDELARLREALSRTNIAPPVRTERAFALGAVLDARGAFDAAFDAFSAGAAAKVEALSAGPPASRPSAVERDHQASAVAIKAMLTPPFLARHAGGGDRSLAPIFIVGMPRSGSSLVEQILASHPAVQAMGEAAILSGVLNGAFPYATDRHPGADPFSPLARAYLGQMRARGWKGRGRFTDKTLENFLHVGMIHLTFPRATILHCVRDPVETCLACFRQLFASGAETLYDLAQIGSEYCRYRAVMDHWAAVLPGRVVEVSYEALVEAPATRIPWLVTEACGLAWSEACLGFFETDRPIATASADQVRRPISRSSLNRRAAYAHRLGPLLDALGPYASSLI